MTLGARNGGFFAGAIGGLLFALLLVGAVSFLPQHNAALQATAPSQDHARGALATEKATTTSSGPAVTSTTSVAGEAVTTATPTTAVSAVGAGGPVVTVTASATTAATSAGQANSAASAGRASSTASQTSAGSPAATTTATTILVTTQSQATATPVPNGSPQALYSSPPYTNSSGTLAHGPSSLLTNLPGQTVGGLLTTVSPLLVGLLVAGLIYSAYLRRQDSA